MFQSCAIACDNSTSFGAKPSALWNSMRSSPGVSEMAAALPGAAFPDAEELLDGLTVEVARVHVAEHVGTFWKPLNPGVLAGHEGSPPLTPCEGAIRYYMILRILLGGLTMNDKGHYHSYDGH